MIKNLSTYLKKIRNLIEFVTDVPQDEIVKFVLSGIENASQIYITQVNIHNLRIAMHNNDNSFI